MDNGSVVLAALLRYETSVPRAEQHRPPLPLLPIVKSDDEMEQQAGRQAGR